MQFQPGQSGNPAGRPPGSGITGKARAIIAAAVPEILAKLVDQAKGGDVAAARILMERVVPALKPGEEAIPIDLGSGSLTERGEAVMQAVAAGEISTSQGAALLSGLGTLVNLTEADDIKRRLGELEARTPGAKK